MFYGKDYQTVEQENNRRINPPEEIEESRKLDIAELLKVANKEKYENAKAYVKEKLSELPLSYQMECLFDGYKLVDYNKIENELREILE